MDFYSLLKDKKRYNIVIVIVNYFSKRAVLIPYNKEIGAKEMAYLFIN